MTAVIRRQSCDTGQVPTSVPPGPAGHPELGLTLAAYLARCGHLPPGEIAEASRVFRRLDLPRGAVLLRAGDPPSRVAFVVSGLLRLVFVDAAGRERTYAFRAEGELTCAYSAALLGASAPYSIEAVEDCVLDVAGHEQFALLCAGHPGWQLLTSRLTEQLYLHGESRQRDLLEADAATRYRRFLETHARLADRVSLRLVASYIGVTPEALSRIRARVDSPVHTIG